MKKSQSSLEFVVLAIAALFLLSVFSMIFYQKLSQKNIEKRNEAIQELALTLQNELNIAAKATDGYSRQFEIPQKVLGLDYSVNLIENSVYINTTNGVHALALPAQNATGNFVKGTNSIRKQNATIWLNS